MKLFLLCLLSAAWLTPFATGAAKLTRGPYLQQSSLHGVHVVWRTEGASLPVVRYGRSPDALTTELSGRAIQLRVSANVSAPSGTPRLYQEAPEDRPKREADHDPSTPPNTYQYEAQVTGLAPASKYYYAIFDGDQKLAGGDADHFFVTHGPVGAASDLRFWVVGDSGTGGTAQAMVHTAMQDYVAKTGRRIDHYLHLGDMAYSDGTDFEFQRGFFAPYVTTLRNTVCWPTMGNHEGHTSRGLSGIGPYYDAYIVPTAAEVGGVASGTEAYYSFDLADIHFICLDSHDLDRSTDAPMARWLRADLERTKAKWLVAFWHHPAYTMGSHNSDRETQLIEMRENFMPILESAGVDLVLTGHSHIYERSMLIDGAYATPTTAKGVVLDDGDGNPAGDGAYVKSAGLNPNEGSVNITAGHGGAGLGREGTMPVMRQIILEHGSVILDVKGDTLTGTMLDLRGETRDLFSIVKRGKVTPRRIENPWEPVHDLALLTEIRVDFAGDTPGSAPAGWRPAAGVRTALSVIADASGQRKSLQARATRTPVIGLYEPYRSAEFQLETDFRLAGNDGAGAGLVFAYRDERNYTRVVADRAAGAVRVIQVTDGAETTLAEGKATLFPGEWHLLEIEIEGHELSVSFRDRARKQPELELEVPIPPMDPAAPFGFFVPAQTGVEFRLFVIEKKI